MCSLVCTSSKFETFKSLSTPIELSCSGGIISNKITVDVFASFALKGFLNELLSTLYFAVFFCLTFKVPIAPNYKGVCLQNTCKSHSYHLKIWQLI